MKINFEKVFDRVSWDFLLHLLERMNFDKKWIKWIRKILQLEKISILVNGSPTKKFTPKRGLRQGDPLSPLLFNLVGDVLDKLLTSAKLKGIFQGIALPGCQQVITHLQFTDDVVLFFKNGVHSIKGIKRVLQCFELLTGLKINFHESCLYGYGEDPSL